jgi:hypothetical protein
MESQVNVKLCLQLSPKLQLVPAILRSTDDPNPSGAVVIPMGWNKVAGPADVQAVYVTPDTPAQLVEAALDSGYLILRQPGR